MSGSDSDYDIDIDEGIAQINNLIVKNIFSYLKTGRFNNKTKETYIAAYTIVYKLSECNDSEYSKKLYNFYTENIGSYMTERSNLIKAKSEEDVIDAFIEETDKCKILIHWMRKVFCYLDKFSNKNNKVANLFATGLKLYHNKFFKPIKEKIIIATNNLFDQHRNGVNIEPKKINDIMNIITYIDYASPVLNKSSEGSLFWTGNFKGEVLDEWFSYFIKSSEYYAIHKANREIASLSAPEYVTSCLKFLKEEDERKNMFIDKNYHNQLDIVNTRNLVENNCKQLAHVWFKLN